VHVLYVYEEREVRKEFDLLIFLVID